MIDAQVAHLSPGVSKLGLVNRGGFHMAIRINTPNGRLVEPEILALEGALGANIPPGYREFLLNFNGGEPEPNVRRTTPPANEVEVDLFYGILKRREQRDLL